MTPVGRGHWCNGQNGEEEENALHPGAGEHSETKNRIQEKREDAGLEDTGWVRLLEGKKGTDRQRGGSATSTWRHTGSLNENKLDKFGMRHLSLTCLIDGTHATWVMSLGIKKKRLKCNKVFLNKLNTMEGTLLESCG